LRAGRRFRGGLYEGLLMDRFVLYTSSVSLRLSLAAAAGTRAKSDSAASAFGFCPAGYTRGRGARLGWGNRVSKPVDRYSSTLEPRLIPRSALCGHLCHLFRSYLNYPHLVPPRSHGSELELGQQPSGTQVTIEDSRPVMTFSFTLYLAHGAACRVNARTAPMTTPVLRV
jgi:hypothetical protein